MYRLVRTATRLLPGDAVFTVDTAEPVAALTFDDGPHPDTTPGLLDVLRAHGARATFFVTGEHALAYPDLVARIVAEGHELGNHLMRDEPSVRLPAAEFRRQLGAVTTLLARYGPVRWFRPGSGWYTPRMLRDAARLGLRCVLGTVAVSNDGGPDDGLLAGRVLRRIHAGSVAVLHEGTPRRRGVAATTSEVLAGLDRRGMRAVTVTGLVAAATGPAGDEPATRQRRHPRRPGR